VPDDHPWLAGTFLNGNPESQIVGRADLMVTIGLEANDIFNASWRYRADVVALEADETNTSHFARVTYQAVGDLEALLTAVVEATAGYSSKWATADVTEYRQSLRSLFGSEDDRLTIPNAISDMRAAAPDESLVAVDAGFGKPLMSYLWRARRPNSYFSSQGLSTMGYALPAATALKLARPDWTVIGSMGDGSLHMRAAELGVAADQGAAPIFVTWVDGSLSQIEIKQRRRNLTPVGVSLPPRSCEKIAAAFGAVGYDVESRADFQAALKDAIERESMPSLIGVRVDNGDRERWFDALRG
jgi:acetolactate synthase-1/2/3 large subunit